MDFDVEMDDAVDTAPPIIEPEPVDILAAEDQEPGEVDESNDDADNAHSDENLIVPTKVHLRGLDTFNPDEVKAYMTEHFGSAPFDRIEWIDDTSANLVFKSESTAQDAVVALSAVEIADATQLPPLQMIPGKPFAAKPDSVLQLRFAVAGDRKHEGAAARSRFYLLNPEYDPEERRRQRARYRDREGGYRRDRYRDRERRYDRDDDVEEEFDVSLYDDDSESRAKRAEQIQHVLGRPKGSPGGGASDPEPRDGRRANEGRELFPDREPRRRRADSRGRSASPGLVRDRDGDQAMDDGRLRYRRSRSRSRSRDRSRDRRASARNRESASSLKERITRENSSKELFPSKLGASSTSTTGKAQMDQVNESQVLATERVVPFSARPGQLGASAASKFNIRGLATQRGPDAGIAIKGTGSAKELFPELLGNAGKELFADKLQGRGQRRQRAEDMFH